MMDDPFPQGLIECIERFLADDGARPCGKDLYEEVFSTGLFFPLQRQAELAAMIRLARTIQPRTVMDIGTDKGGGLYHWVKCLPTVRTAIACEIRGLPYSHAFCRTFPQVDFRWVDDGSQSDLALSVAMDCQPIDVLFIDGDKSSFEADFWRFLPFMHPGGLVFFHDITDPAPGETYRKVCEIGLFHREFIDTSDSAAALARQEAGIQSSCPHEDWLRHWAGKSCGVGVVTVSQPDERRVAKV
jgi:predicted O-methyltransferase YrrM